MFKGCRRPPVSGWCIASPEDAISDDCGPMYYAYVNRGALIADYACKALVAWI